MFKLQIIEFKSHREPWKNTHISLPIPLCWPVISSPQLSEQAGWLQRPDILQSSEIRVQSDIFMQA